MVIPNTEAMKYARMIEAMIKGQRAMYRDKAEIERSAYLEEKETKDRYEGRSGPDYPK